jgi:curved DNA-binding protein CbpA
MPDYFALLEEPRRPWIAPDQLKEKFLALSAKTHPDRMSLRPEAERHAAHQHFTEINAAYQCLREPKDRLLHLLEIESGTRPANLERLPTSAADLAFEAGQVCRNVDAFLREKSKVTSPLLRAQSFEKALEWADRLNELKQSIRSRSEQVADELRTMNAVWESAPPGATPQRRAILPLERLDQIYRTLSYLSRWNEQLGARIVRLSV